MTRTRHIPTRLAPVLEELELEQPQIVTKEYLADILSRTDVTMSTAEVAERLQRQGWLLSLRTRGAWEFAPASRSGSIGAGDPFIEFRATLARRSDFRAAVAYDSAAWMNNLSRRPPIRHVIAINPDYNTPHALRDLRITRNWAELDPVKIDNLPVWRIESLIVLMCTYPNAYRDWPNTGSWLGEGVEQLDAKSVLQELEGRPRATWARTGYLLETACDHSLGARIYQLMPAGRGPVYFGKRTAPAQYNKRWQVVDSLLLHAIITAAAQHPGEEKNQDMKSSRGRDSSPGEDRT